MDYSHRAGSPRFEKTWRTDRAMWRRYREYCKDNLISPTKDLRETSSSLQVRSSIKSPPQQTYQVNRPPALANDAQGISPPDKLVAGIYEIGD